jgi:DNA transformation protein
MVKNLLPGTEQHEANVQELFRLVNLGPKSAANLVAAGITSFSQITKIGSVASYVRIKRAGINVSLNLLWALEGAISGEPWQTVAREHRASLLLALEQCEHDG